MMQQNSEDQTSLRLLHTVLIELLHFLSDTHIALQPTNWS